MDTFFTQVYRQIVHGLITSKHYEPVELAKHLHVSTVSILSKWLLKYDGEFIICVRKVADTDTFEASKRTVRHMHMS